MDGNLGFSVNGKPADAVRKGRIAYAELQPGDELALTFPLETREEKEPVAGRAFTVVWRGCDVVDLLPRGEHVRLYQRDKTKPKYYPTPDDVVYTGAANYGPTQQKGGAK